MCLIAIAVDAHPDLPLVLVSNRDEFTERSFRSVGADFVKCECGSVLICGLDKKSTGTWLGVNVTNALTNIGSYGGGQLSKMPKDNAVLGSSRARGALVKAVLLNPSETVRAMDADTREGYAGFNLLFGNVRPGSPVQYITNWGEGATTRHTTEIVRDANSVAGSRVIGLGNDMLADEFVKAPYVARRLHDVLKKIPEGGAAENDVPTAVIRIRDEASAVFTEKSLPPCTLLALLSKFFKFSRTRRVQPGLRTTLGLFAVLSLVAPFAMLFAGGRALSSLVYGVVVAAIVALACGFWHHVRLQHPFVDVNVPFFHFSTISQTVVVVHRPSSKLFYFFRDTTYGEIGEWKMFTAPVRMSHDTET